MPKALVEWTVQPHGAIEKLSPRVWRVEGSLPNMPLKRVMTVARTERGELVVHSAMALEPAAMAEIEAFGEVRFILVPNGFHRLDAPAFAARYPNAKVLCPPGSKARVAQVVRVDGVYADFPADAAVSLHVLDGVGGQEGYVRIDEESGVTLILNDLVFNMPHLPGAQGFMLRYVTASSGGPTISRIGRLFLVKDKARVRAQIEALAATERLTRVIVSHHETIVGTKERSAGEVLRDVARTALG